MYPDPFFQRTNQEVILVLFSEFPDMRKPIHVDLVVVWLPDLVRVDRGGVGVHRCLQILRHT